MKLFTRSDNELRFFLRTFHDFFPKKIDQTSSYFVEKIEIRRNYALDFGQFYQEITRMETQEIHRHKQIRKKF